MTDKSQRKEDSDADGVAKRTSGGSAGGSAKKGAAGATGSAGGSATPAGSGTTSHSKEGGATTAGSGTTSHSKGGATTAAARTYTVKAGDSLSKIAKEVYGDAAQWKKIYEANRQVIGANPDLIKPGQVLTIPA